MVYLQIFLSINDHDRPAAAEIYQRYKVVFLKEIPGSLSKSLLIREQDVQVLHGFDTHQNAQAYLDSRLFNDDVVTSLKPLLQHEPEIRFYEVI